MESRKKVISMKNQEIISLQAALAELKEENPIAHATQIAKIEFRIQELQKEINGK